MLNAIAIVPSAPIMVPELASSAAAETADLREAALSAVAGLPSWWIGIGVAATAAVVGPEAVGTFGGYGVGVRVGLSAEAVDSGRPPAALPLCALIGGWLRGRAQPLAAMEMRAVAADLAVADAVQLGARLRTELDAVAEPVGVLIVADGANTLTAPAPGGYDPDSLPVQAALDDALAGGDCDALTRLPAGIIGRAAYQVLAGLAGPARRSAKELYRGAPYGVGYFVGIWGP